jgi:hypothetical protein
MNDDDLDDFPPPLRPSFDDKTAWGRINGRDRRRYARLWGVDLDRPREELPEGVLMSGEEEFSLDIKLMFFDRYKTEDAMRDQGMSWGEAHVDEEEFAEAWRPPTESEMLDEIIAERIAALARDPASREPDDAEAEPFEARDPDFDPEPHH